MLWPKVAVLAIALVGGSIVFSFFLRKLNAIALGSDVAARLGVDVRRIRTILFLVGTAMTGAAVGTVGIIGFIGLVAPHVSRGLVGSDWRKSAPCSLAIGALLLVVADLAAQRLLFPKELPLGVVTALVGAPVLLMVLNRHSD